METFKNSLTNRLILILSLLFLLSISLSSVNATTIDITSTDDLGHTISTANNGDEINLDNGTYTTNVTNIIIDKNLTIQGKNSQNTIIDAEKFGRIFNITPGNTLTLINITLKNGKATLGGAIYNNGGSLTLTNTIFINNNATSQGGAIYNVNGSNLNITNSIFDNNNAAVTGGAIDNYNVTNMTIYNSVFSNNTAPFGATIATENGTNTSIINCKFTNNIANSIFPRSSILDLRENNSFIQGCNIYNNNQGFNNSYAIIIEPNSNITINYNRIFNNTGYTIYNFAGTNTNMDYNWWGNNTPDMTKIIGVIPKNYFVMNITNLTSLDSNGTVLIQYAFKLNDSSAFDPNLLPYFVTDVYTNVTSGAIDTFDARFDRIINSTLSVKNQTVEYTFITDNEIQTLNVFFNPKIKTIIEVNNVEGEDGETVTLIAILTDENGTPLAGKEIIFNIAGQIFTAITDSNGIATIQYTINKDDFIDGKLAFTATFEEDENYLESILTGTIALTEEQEPTPDNNDTNQTTNNLANINKVNAAMKETGIPINLILITLLSVLGLVIGRKE